VIFVLLAYDLDRAAQIFKPLQLAIRGSGMAKSNAMNTREREPRGWAVTQSAAADWRDPESFRGVTNELGCKLRWFHVLLVA